MSAVSHLAAQMLLEGRRPLADQVVMRHTAENKSQTQAAGIEEKNQNLIVEPVAKHLHVNADVIRFTQVLANLLTNASKYTDEKGVIRLSTKCKKDQVVIEIHDNGIGISAELLPDVFKAFTQEKRSRDYAKGGLGLGLSLVQQLVELHGGSVGASSEGPGKGSVFFVSVPIESAPPDSIVTDNPSVTDAPMDLIDSPSRRVLIVEDTAGIARMTSILFKKLGYVPFVAADGATAVTMFRKHHPEIVLLDLMLPDVSGLSVAKEIRGHDSSNATLIVAMTGHSDDENRRLASESGFDEYFVKPVDIRQLRELAAHPKLKAADRASCK